MTAMAFSAMSAAMAASLAVAPTPNRPTPGTRITRGSGIEFLLLHRALVVVAGEIVVIARHEGIDGGANLARPFVELARIRRGHDQRPVLGADGMIGRHHALLAVARQLGAIHIVQNRRIGAEIQDLPFHGARHGVLLDGDRAAQDRRDLRQPRRDSRATAPLASGLR